jgi:hypothetical protein
LALGHVSDPLDVLNVDRLVEAVGNLEVLGLFRSAKVPLGLKLGYLHRKKVSRWQLNDDERYHRQSRRGQQGYAHAADYVT